MLSTKYFTLLFLSIRLLKNMGNESLDIFGKILKLGKVVSLGGTTPSHQVDGRLAGTSASNQVSRVHQPDVSLSVEYPVAWVEIDVGLAARPLTQAGSKEFPSPWNIHPEVVNSSQLEEWASGGGARLTESSIEEKSSRLRESSTWGCRISTQGELDLGRKNSTQGQLNLRRYVLNSRSIQPEEEVLDLGNAQPEKENFNSGNTQPEVGNLNSGSIQLMEGDFNMGRKVLNLGRAQPGEVRPQPRETSFGEEAPQPKESST
ncbi:hypothetical protein FNV43_RR09695 [Rhamnella rubrinervis]|uniref:Uncharacterized protein n=1 Tax=Rhamnella rubrinervis TaxID=2594499 RepID=A0A8K0MK10_9ROSA|nr:hypothetical protein FNV43_RR09695 [Rhamnella rubrinervis]